MASSDLHVFAQQPRLRHEKKEFKNFFSEFFFHYSQSTQSNERMEGHVFLLLHQGLGKEKKELGKDPSSSDAIKYK
jgi:hypothetical protein